MPTLIFGKPIDDSEIPNKRLQAMRRELLVAIGRVAKEFNPRRPIGVIMPTSGIETGLGMALSGALLAMNDVLGYIAEMETDNSDQARWERTLLPEELAEHKAHVNDMLRQSRLDDLIQAAESMLKAAPLMLGTVQARNLRTAIEVAKLDSEKAEAKAWE